MTNVASHDGSHRPAHSLWLAAALLLVAVGCAPSTEQSGPLPPPVVGDIPSVTHQDRLTLFGHKPPSTAIYLNGVLRIPLGPERTWSAVVDLPAEGPNPFILQTLDQNGNLSSPLAIEIVRDTVAPGAPIVTSSPPPSSAVNPVVIFGTKESGTFLRINGRIVSPLSPDTTWLYEVTVVDPSSDFSITAVDEAGNESAATVVTIGLTGTCSAPPALVFPLNGGAVLWGASFRWQAVVPVPPNDYVFELSDSPAFDAMFVPTTPVTGITFAPSGAAPPPGVYYWRVGSVNTCGTSYSLPRTVLIGSTSGDVTGDGFADIVVGAPGDDGGGIGAGAAYVFPGGPSQPFGPTIAYRTALDGSALGRSVAKLGDIDHDGYVDVLVGAPYEGGNAGAAYLFWGGPSATPEPALVLRGEGAQGLFGHSVAGLDDINGDGYADIAVGAYQAAVAAECAGTASIRPLVGRVYVFYGGPRDVMDSISDAVFTGETTEIPDDVSSPCRSGDEFGLALASAGDVNGDGYGDMVVGSRGYDDGANQDAGRAYVFFGGPWFTGVGAERADVVRTGSAAGDQFGAAVAGLGDLNGDEFSDVAVGIPQGDSGGSNSGSVAVYTGNSGGLAPAPVILSGAADDDTFGSSVGAAGDLNRDGRADLVVGAFQAGVDDNGSASFYFGNTGGLLVPVGTIFGELDPDVGDQFGRAVSGAGDVDGDGYDDAVVGSMFHDVCVIPDPFCFDAGRAYVFHGQTINGHGPIDPAIDWLLTGVSSGDYVGGAVD